MTNISVISKYSFREIYRSKLMINALWVSVIVLILTYITSEFSFGKPEKIAIDFGLSLSSLATSLISIFTGVSLISSEIESRTAYVILSRPVSRKEFLTGKMIGVAAFLFINIILINLFSLAAFFYFGGSFNSQIAWAILFSYFEALVLLLIAIVFSLITNKTISVINSLVIFLLGHAIPNSLQLPIVQKNEILSGFLKACSFIVPNLNNLNIKNHIVMNNELGVGLLQRAAVSSVLYIIFLYFLCIWIFDKRELN